MSPVERRCFSGAVYARLETCCAWFRGWRAPWSRRGSRVGAAARRWRRGAQGARVSVVIRRATRGAARALPRGPGGRSGRLEVIVVDDGSRDGTARAPRAAGARVVAGTERAGWVGKPWALQQGLEAATGDIVVCLDADTRPARGLLGALAAALDDADFVTRGRPLRRHGARAVDVASTPRSHDAGLPLGPADGARAPSRGWWPTGRVMAARRAAARGGRLRAGGGHVPTTPRRRGARRARAGRFSSRRLGARRRGDDARESGLTRSALADVQSRAALAADGAWCVLTLGLRYSSRSAPGGPGRRRPARPALRAAARARGARRAPGPASGSRRCSIRWPRRCSRGRRRARRGPGAADVSSANSRPISVMRRPSPMTCSTGAIAQLHQREGEDPGPGAATRTRWRATARRTARGRRRPRPGRARSRRRRTSSTASPPRNDAKTGTRGGHRAATPRWRPEAASASPASPR